jgi:hypothetical protein
MISGLMSLAMYLIWRKRKSAGSSAKSAHGPLPHAALLELGNGDSLPLSVLRADEPT